MELYDHNGKMSNFDLNANSGLPSKLMGMFNLPLEQFNPQAVRKRMEDLLRPFVVANKSKFLDFPEEAFSSHREEEREHLQRLNEPVHRNWSKRFNGSPPLRGMM